MSVPRGSEVSGLSHGGFMKGHKTVCRSFSLGVAILAGTLVASDVSAEQIDGRVAQIEEGRVKIEYQSDFMPREGDAVQIGFELAGEFIPVRGEWRIVVVSPAFAWAEAGSADLESVATGYLAIIESPDPQRGAEVSEPQGELVREEFRRGTLGMVVVDLTKKRRDNFGIPDSTKGAFVQEVAPQSGAARAGIVSGDIISLINGKPISSGQQLVAMISEMEPGLVIDLTVVRDGRTKSVRATLSRMQRGEEYFLIGQRYLIDKNYEEAIQWFRQGAELGDGFCQTTLAGMYDIGQGVTEDDVEALKWYRRAARQGIRFAQRRLKAKGETW